MGTQKYEIQPTKSSIEWIGRKVTGAHNGTVAIKQGYFIFKDDQLIGGKVIIDVASIKVLDITDPVTNAQFAGHLASYDFFYSEYYPEAIFEITSAFGSLICGNLTIKGKTHPLSFNAQIRHRPSIVVASGKMIIDRTKYGMKFRSGNFFKDLGECLIHNEFDLNINITALAAGENQEAL